MNTAISITFPFMMIMVQGTEGPSAVAKALAGQEGSPKTSRDLRQVKGSIIYFLLGLQILF